MKPNKGSAILWAVSAAIMLLVAAATAQAQPSGITAAGTWSHQTTVTISGAGFGSKSTAAPVIWDDASGSNILSKWDDAWPNCSGNSAYNLTYRTPAEVGRNIPLPHNHITKYLSGAHYGPSPGPQCSYAVNMYKVRTITSFPAYTYTSWYQRMDDNWHFGDDNNVKLFAYSEGVGPYNAPNNWYTAYNTPNPNSPADGASYIVNDDSNFNTLMLTDTNGHSHWWDAAVNPMSGVWTKVEMELKYTNQTDGYMKLWENGVLRINYAGSTDKFPGSTRTEGIGGYGREYPFTSNWRYFADVYLDYSRARVILGNAPTLAASTIREVQVPTNWSASSISVNVNLGRFANGQTAYLYVFDTNGVANSAGVPITIGSGGGGGGDTTPPTASMTAPAIGATVSSTVPVSGTASDNIAVTGVQFKLDGVNLAAEDTASPYSITWDTATATNGAHTLTAVARDAAGNQTASTTRSVTVSNAAPPPPIGLVAAYGFGEGSGSAATDASGNNNVATIAGAAWTAQGHSGPALSFDGVSSIVTIADSASLDLAAGMTLEAWLNPTSITGWRTVFMKEISGGLAYAMYANESAPKPSAYAHLVGQTQSSGAGGVAGLPLNTWTHLATTYDGTTLRLFVNGTEVSNAPASGSMMQSSNPLRVGGNAVWGEYFAGLIDDVRVYDRALSASQILSDLSTPVGGGTGAPHAPANVRIVP